MKLFAKTMSDRVTIGGSLFALGLLALSGPVAATGLSANLAALAKTGTVNERFQSYNVEMVEVTGGRFWAPYGGPADEVYRERAPIDLTHPRLVTLASHLGPSLMRVSGTWANNTYVKKKGESLTSPPPGFKQMLTREQWSSVVAFSKAVDAPIVTSFAVSAGTRDANGRWTTVQAQRLADLTQDFGGRLYAAEFFNEPNVPGATQGMPAGYDAAQYADEFRLFKSWANKALPDMKILGPGGIGEGSLTKDLPANAFVGGFIRSEDMMKANPGSLDVVTYHFYGTVSQRCHHMGMGSAVKDEALTAAWLDRTLLDEVFYAQLRDIYEPGKPLWNTETAQAACGGSPWAASFLDTFRYLNQLGVLAQKNVQVVMHNTLAASEYALIDQDTLEPRPNYWAAVLWRRTMGRTVLAPPASPAADVRVFAHCLPEGMGGVGLLALNTGETARRWALSGETHVWTLKGQPIDTRQITVNEQLPTLLNSGQIGGLDSVKSMDLVDLPAHSVTFVAVPSANNAACFGDVASRL